MVTRARWSRATRFVWCCVLLCGAVQPAAAEQSDHGPFRIHYNAFTTDTLTERTARDYGIVRSRNRALLNVSVQLREAARQGHPVTAQITAVAINLNGQLRQLEMRELTQGEAIYYIAEMPITDRETYHYDLSIQPAGSSESIQLKFTRQFFVN